MSALEKDAWRITFGEVKAAAEDIIEDARNGRIFILVDDEDRENEGDLVIPAQMGDARSHQLHGQARPRPDLPAHHPRAGGATRPAADGARTTALGTRPAFTVSIEAREGVTTGISADDRAHTIAVGDRPHQAGRRTS